MTAAIVINTHIMRSLTIALALIICTTAWAGHKQGNGTCEDDMTHWKNMVGYKEKTGKTVKRTDAPLHEKSVKMFHLAEKANSVWQCENLMEEALRMIRSPYPTE